MRRTARLRRWLPVSTLVVGLVALTAGLGQAQPQGGGRGGFGGDPDAMWARIAQGKDSVNLNENPWMRGMMERNGDPIPPDGVLTKDAFKANSARRAAQGGGVGGRGGSAPAAPGGVPAQATPGALAAPGGAEWVEGRFRESDTNKDGFLSAEEASGKLKQSLPQYDKSGDGKIDLNEYKGYMAERFAGGPNGPGGLGPIPPPPDYNAQFGAGMGRNQAKREEEDTARVSVSRFGKLPKEAPAFFTEYDDDRDGMVGLYEWRRHGRKSADFVEMDLNADGYLTADEWLRYNRLAIEKRDQESPAERVATPNRGGPPSSGSDKGKDRTSRTKSNPFAPGR